MKIRSISWLQYNNNNDNSVGNSVSKLNDANAELAYSNETTGGLDKEVELLAWMGPDYSHEVSVSFKHWFMMWISISANLTVAGCLSGIRCCYFHGIF